MTDPLKFQDLLEKLNPKQREAVDTIEGPVMVIAGPGTGKTQILTLRIANILKKTDASADSILALTFTESAAANMRRRLVSIIGSKGYYVTIGTFHGFANSLIQDYPEYFPAIISSKSATDLEKIALIRNLIENLDLKVLKPFGEKFFYALDILSAIKNLKSEGISPDKFIELIKESQKSFHQIPDLYHEKGAHRGKMKGEYQKELKQIEKNLELSQIYLSYEAELRRLKRYDFEDMLLQTIKAFEDYPDFLLEVQEKYQYILVDEHQDSNGAQNKLLEQVASFYEAPNLFVVGDEKQAIFRFQGASLENFLYFKNRYPTVKLINLESNYRSTQSILDSAGSLIEKNKTTILAPLKSEVGPAGQKIKIASFDLPEAELFFVARKIKEFLDLNIPASEIAILYRENRDAQKISAVLNQLAVPYVVESEDNILNDPEIKKINLLLEAVDHLGSGEKLAQIFHLDFLNLHPLDTYKLIEASRESRIGLASLIRNQDKISALDLENPSAFTSLLERMALWHRQSKNKNFVEFFEILITESGFLNHLLALPNYPEKINHLSAIFKEIKKMVENKRDFGIGDYVEYLKILSEHGILIKNKLPSVLGRVRLMTAHRAKGLEFKIVFVLGAVNGHWGNRREFSGFKLPIKTSIDISSIEKNEDERRLFYMAITRAKDEVFISWASHNEEGREQVPSQFIEEIDSKFREDLLGNALDQEITNHREILFNQKNNQAPTLKEGELIKDLFERRGFSVTALNNYLNCPWRYFYLNLIRIPKTKNNYQIFGTAVHFALKNFFESRKSGKDFDSTYLIDQFKYKIEQEPISEEALKILEKKGESILKPYYENYNKEWNYNTVGEFRINGVILGENIKLNGILDKIEIQPNPSKVIVVDYKTKKPESRNSIEGKTKSGSGGDYKRQLVFYKLLLDLKPEKTWEMQSGVIDFVEANERGIFKKEEFEISNEETEELSDIIKKSASEILNFSFWEKTCGDKTCEYCTLRQFLG